jgi:hypothetical protein
MPIFNSENLMGSPLGMAGLGLLMQPTVSRNPQNPMGAALGGAMAAGQYRNDQQQFAGQQAEAAMRAQRLQFEMDEALRKREQEAQQLAQAERQKAEIEKAVQESGDPALRSLYAIGGPEAAAKYLGESMKPASPMSGVGKLAADLRAANPSMSVADSMVQAEGMLNERARAGAANSTLEVKQFPPPPTGYYYVDPSRPELGLKTLAGGPGDPAVKPLTESEGNATMFYNRAKETNRELGASEYNATGLGAAKDRATVGGPMTNWMASGEGQKFNALAENFVTSILRKESGAAISESEWAMARRMYIPMPGDSPEVIAQKADNRKLAIEGLKVTAGPGASRIGQEVAPQDMQIAPSQPASQGAVRRYNPQTGGLE